MTQASHSEISPSGITADDWGLSRGVNQGILQLVQKGVVRRVSLLANGPELHHGLSELLQLSVSNKVELGLHFNLTYGKCSSSPFRILLRWLNFFDNPKKRVLRVRSEFTTQLQKLQSEGVSVRYMDGHQHIHLVPGLLEAIADLLKAAQIQYVRLPYDPALWISAKAPVAFLALIARPIFKRHGFLYRPFIYPSLKSFEQPHLLKALIQKHPHSEIIVHPAEFNDLDDLEYPDSYTEGRIIEFQALKSLCI